MIKDNKNLLINSTNITKDIFFELKLWFEEYNTVFKNCIYNYENRNERKHILKNILFEIFKKEDVSL